MLEGNGNMETLNSQKRSKLPLLDRNSTSARPQKNYFDLLPDEILLKIFLYVKADGIFKFYDTLTKVCTTWEKIVMDCKLWQVVTVPECRERGLLQFMQWQKHGLLSKTKKLNLVNLGEFLNIKKLKAICLSCPELQYLAIGKLEGRLTKDFFQTLSEACPNLSHLNISCIKTFIKTCLDDFLHKGGHNIVQFRIAETSISGCHLISSFALYCPNIQELHITNVSGLGIQFPVEELQEKCPAIRILHLTNTSFNPCKKNVDSPGFLNLEEISLAVLPHKDSVSDDCFWRILNKSSKLKSLDICGCTKLSSETIIRLPANDLESIFMSRTEVHLMGNPELIMAKYKHSLRDVDLSWNKCSNTVTLMIENLVCGEASPLEVLDLTGTRIELPIVRVILDNFIHLRVLKLQGCRSIERNWRNLCYHNSMQEFRQEIEKYLEINLV